MKLSAKTISILKNFAVINPSIVVKPGNTISTISSNKTIMARATLQDTFESEFAIYALNRFISGISLMDDPELDFSTNSVRIRGNGHSILYHFADPSVIIAPPDKEIKIPSIEVECELSSKNIQNVAKALGVLGLPEIAITGNDGKIFLQAVDSKNGSADNYSIEIGETDRKFMAIFKSENMKMLDDNYQVKISSKGISQFVGTDVTYWIAVEATSTF